MPRNRGRLLLSVVLETALTGLCGLAALFIRFDGEAPNWLLHERGWLRLLVIMAVVQGSFYLFDLYELKLIRQRSVLFVRLCQTLAFASIALTALYFFLPAMEIGRGVFLLSVALMFALMTCWRLLAMWLMGHPRLAERVLILGTDKSAINLAREILEQREQGYHVVGFVGDDPSLLGKSLINPRVIGLTPDIESVVHTHRIDRIVVAVDQRRGRLPLDSLLRLKLPDRVAIEESLSFYETLTGKVNLEMLRPSWLIFSTLPQSLRLYKRIRRLLDVVLSVVGLVVSFPVMVLAAIAIKLDSRGPVFYTQDRVGHHDEIFKIVKFRSMRTDAEQAGPVWADERDPRVTFVGRVIRKLRIDELPQFFNVIKGDMSFIGPRPERPVFVEQLEREIPYYSQRHLVKPGLTGWAQVRYRYGASVEDATEKLQYDLYYIKNQSPVLDAIILFETVRMVLFGKGAR
jgi:sugar transferase (PEP-CTERM system associated)